MENLGVSESRALSKPSNFGASPTPPVTPNSRNSYSRKRKLVSRDPATAGSSKTTFCIDTDNSSSSNGSQFSCADLDLEPPPKTGSRSRLIFDGAPLKDSTGTIEFLPHSSEIRRNAQPKGPNIEDSFKERNNLNTLREGGDTCFQHNAIESYSNTYRRHHSFSNGRNASQAGYQSSYFYSYPHWTRFPNFQAFCSTTVLEPHCLPSTYTSICSPADVIQQHGDLHSTSAASVSCPAIALQSYNLSTTPASLSCPANALQPYDLPSTSASVSSPLGVHTHLAPYTPEKRVPKIVGNNSLSLASINSNITLATSELVETLFGVNSNPISNLEDHGLSAVVESQKRSVSTNDKAEAQEQTLMGASCVDVNGHQTECISLAATQMIPQLERTLTKGKKIMDVSASAELEHKNKDASYIRLNTDQTHCFSLVSSQITAESEITSTKGQVVFGEGQIVTADRQEEVILGDVQEEDILNLNRASKQKERRRKHRPKVKVECSSKNSQAKKSRNKSGTQIAVKRRKQKTAANDSIGTDISSKLQKDTPTDQINDQCHTYENFCQLNSSAKALETERPMPGTENTENLNLLQTTAQIQKMNLPDNLEDDLQGMSPSVQNKDTLGDSTIAVSMPEQQAGSVKRKRTSRKNAKQLARKGRFSALHSKEKQKESLEIAMSADQAQNKNPQIRNMPATSLLALEESFINVEEDELTEMMKKLKLDEAGWEIVLSENRELVPCIVNKDIVTYEGPFHPLKKRKPRARVTLDNETNRIWRLLMGKASTDDSNPTDKEEKEKQWEEERKIFKGRVDSFIARMHLVQGDRRFSKWKGSIVDSVIGAFLTQNVADHLSSSAFMALASRFPPIPPIEKSELTAEDDKDFSEADLDLNKISNEVTDTSQNLEGLTDASTSSESYASNYVSDKGTFSPLTTSNCSSIASKGPHTESEICTPTEQTLCLDCSNNVSEQLTMNSMENSSSGGLTFFGDLLKEVERKAGENSENVLRSEASEPSCDTEVSVDLGLCSESMLDMLNEQKSQLQESMSTFLYESSGTGNIVNSIIAGAECSPDTEESVNATAGICSPDKKEKSCSAEANVNSAEIIRCLEKSNCQVSRHVVSETPRRNIKYTKYCARNLHLHDMHPPEEYAIESRISSQSSMQPGARNMLNNDTLKEQMQSSTLQSNKLPKRNTSGIDRANIEMKQGASKKTSDWEKIKKKIFSYQYNYCRTKKDRDQNSKDAVNWEAVRCADVEEIAETIRDRGMNNVLAGRIKVFLERVHSEQGCIDLEWLKDVPPDDAKDFLLGVRGLGLKSVECIRLLALQHLAFPVDTNVGRICVRLGWVPIQPLPESLQLHLLELYPILESIQKYLWPRLCTLDQRTLYELHYQMITFGKVFCTKSKPNCNACPMRCDCKHFASAFASARLALPAPSEESALVHSESNFLTLPTVQSIYQTIDTDICNNNFPKHLLEAKPEEFKDQNITTDACNNSSSDHLIEASPEVSKCEPIIEEPMTPEPENVECSESAAEEYMDPDEIPVINLNYEQLQLNVQKIYEGTVQDGDTTSGTVSKALVIMSPAVASIPEPKLKNVGRLRTEHRVYELPDDHPLLNEFESREADDATHYLLAIWSPGETADSIGATEQFSNLKECEKHHCEKESCNSCLANQDSNENTVKGTMLIPVKTAMRGSFPLNGTYFQVNEVFADHETSLRPMKVPRSWIWNLERRTVYFGTSIPTIFRGLPTGEIQKCFWRGFVCVRGFDRQVRAPRPLVARLHFPASKQVRPQKRETAHRKPKPKLTEKTQTQTSDTNRNEISSIK